MHLRPFRYGEAIYIGAKCMDYSEEIVAYSTKSNIGAGYILKYGQLELTPLSDFEIVTEILFGSNIADKIKEVSQKFNVERSRNESAASEHR